MTAVRNIAFFCIALGVLAAPAGAQPVTRLKLDIPSIAIAQAVTVPPGYTTYYISGTPARPRDPNAPDASPTRWGNTAQQTSDALNAIQATLARLGLTFGDVVKATVFLAGDPAFGGDMDFHAMNVEWAKRFGTANQPNEPARSTVQVGLATPGALVEIEIIAVKKATQ
ncbi:MAG: Rid family hydrolase [Alphaproteobacteria bacterium]